MSLLWGRAYNLRQIFKLHNFFVDNARKERCLDWLKAKCIGIDYDDLDDQLLVECDRIGGVEICVDLAFDALKNDCVIERLTCPNCGFPLADEYARMTSVCCGCFTITMSSPSAVGNPLGDRICMYWELFDEFDSIADRMG